MTRWNLVAILSVAAVFGCQPAVEYAGVFDGSAGRWVDLTYSYSSETIYWPTAEPFVLREESYGVTEGGYFYSANNFCAAEHGGTHFDAPIHFAQGGQTVEQVPLDRLIAAAVVVDVTDHVNPDYQLQVEDLENWEAERGAIPDGAIVLVRTGWGTRWPDRLRYLGTDRTGPEAVAELHFPGIGSEAARWLVEERSIAAIGIDTPSIDFGQSTRFETHVIVYGANIPGFENIANLEQLPEKGAYVIALPMKIEGGSGGPLRIVGFIPNALAP